MRFPRRLASPLLFPMSRAWHCHGRVEPWGEAVRPSEELKRFANNSRPGVLAEGRGSQSSGRFVLRPRENEEAENWAARSRNRRRAVLALLARVARRQTPDRRFLAHDARPRLLLFFLGFLLDL